MREGRSGRRWAVAIAATLAVAATSGAPAQSGASAGESPLAGLELVEGELGWAGMRLGISPPRVERMVGTTVALDPSRSFACAPYSSNVEWKGLTLTLGFSKASPSAKLVSIEVHFEGFQVAATREQLIADLKQRLPDAAYRAVPGGSTPEADDARPVYTVASARDGLVRLTTRDQILLARRACLP